MATISITSMVAARKVETKTPQFMATVYGKALCRSRAVLSPDSNAGLGLSDGRCRRRPTAILVVGCDLPGRALHRARGRGRSPLRRLRPGRASDMGQESGNERCDVRRHREVRCRVRACTKVTAELHLPEGVDRDEAATKAEEAIYSACGNAGPDEHPVDSDFKGSL